MRVGIFIFHITLACHYGVGIYYYLFELKPIKEVAMLRSGMGGPLKFLTFWNMIVQWSFFTLAAINDLVSYTKDNRIRNTKLQRYQDFSFSTIVFSTGAFVSTSFWGIYLVNRELIFPKSLDSFFPVWLNHNIHTGPVIGVIIEMLTTRHKYPPQRKGFLTVAVFVALYLGWVCFIAYSSGIWVYPILMKLTVVGRVAFMAAMCILCGLFYVAGEGLNTLIWGKNSKIQQKSL